MNPKSGPAPGSASEVRELRRHIAEAGDEKILKIVRLMDTLDQRGASDALLAPVRPRLAAMRPSHPLRFARLLFTPADPLIVARDEWRPGMPAVPRVALPILADFVRGLMSGAQATIADRDALARIDTLIEGATTADADIIRAAGLVCWPRVATTLNSLAGSGAGSTDDSGSRQACVTAWREAGLPAEALTPIASGLAAMLEIAPLLDPHTGGTVAPGSGRLMEQLTQKLAATEAPDMQAWGMLCSLLLIRLPEHAAASLRSRAALLDNLVRGPGDPGRRRRAAAARAVLRDTTWARFNSALETEIIAQVRHLPKNELASAERAEALEAAARRLHDYESSARTLGGGPTAADIRQQLEKTLRDAPGLSPMDRARLLELMGDTAAARALLDQ
jgi:hypothetical protein